MNELTAVLISIFATFIGAFGSLYLKMGSATLHRNLFLIVKNKKLLFGILLFVFASIFYIWALKYGRLSLLYPMSSLTYIWVCFLSLKFLGEKMNNYKWLGIVFIIVGVLLITR